MVSASEKGAMCGGDGLGGRLNASLPVTLSRVDAGPETAVGAIIRVNLCFGGRGRNMDLPIASPSEASLDEVGDDEEACLQLVGTSAACILVMDRSTSGRWFMPSAPLAFRRFGVGPDVADGDTCLERLRGVRVADVRYDEFCDGVEKPVLRDPCVCPNCCSDTDVAER